MKRSWILSLLFALPLSAGGLLIDPDGRLEPSREELLRQQPELIQYAINNQEFRSDVILKVRAAKDVSASGYRNISLVHIAACHPSIDSFDELASRGGDINAQMAGGLTPLMLAIRCGQHNAFWSLLREGADIHIKDDMGHDALTWAIAYDREFMIEDLIKAGANLSKLDDEGRSLRDYALAQGQLVTLAMLMSQDVSWGIPKPAPLINHIVEPLSWFPQEKSELRRHKAVEPERLDQKFILDVEPHGRLSMSEFAGKPLVVVHSDFYGIYDFGYLAAIKRMTDELGDAVSVIVVSERSNARILWLLKKAELDLPVYVGGRRLEAAGALYDEQGQLRFSFEYPHKESYDLLVHYTKRLLETQN
jgi:hypothetical protein